MFDVALSNAGAQITLATSSDANLPPENMIDGKSETFWVTTGLFPQTFVVTFQSLMNVNTIKFACSNVRRLGIERCVQNEPTDFEPLDERELENSSGVQGEEFTFSNKTAQHLKFTVHSAYDHFISVHQVNVSGTAVHGS